MSDPPPQRPVPARPGAPDVQRRTSAAGRPGRPDRQAAKPKPQEPTPPPVIAETTVIAPPPRVRRSSPFASKWLRQTLLPPCTVTGVGLVALGSAYFAQAPDAALRQVPAAAAIVLLGLGAACVVIAGLLAWSLRR